MNIKKIPIRIHHIGSHFTSAMLPAASVLLTIFIFTGEPRFEYSAFLCLIFGAFAAPFVFFSGFYDWSTRFKARHTHIFDHKLFFGPLLMVVTLVLAGLRVFLPDIVLEEGSGRWVYIIAVYIATGIVAYLGYLGSKFI